MTTIKLSAIVSAPWNTRSEITAESVSTLAASIKADGLIQPINLIRAADGDGYVCYDGNRRLAAAQSLGWDEIPAIVCDITEDEARVRTVTANLQRADDDPLLAARVIGDLVAGGMDSEEIAAKLGKTVAWVNRRRRLTDCADALAEVAGKLTLDALERVAALPEEPRKRVIKAVKDKSKYMGRLGVAEIRYDIERESAVLDGRYFVDEETEIGRTNLAKCRACPKRTGAEPDLFGDVENGGLGRCLDCKCFREMVKATEKRQIADAVKGAAEVVRIDYAWQLPDEVKASKATKPSKKHPCAWVCLNGATVEVHFGPSKKELDAAEAAATAAKEAERAAGAADRERSAAISRAMSEAFPDGNDWPVGLIGRLEKYLDSATTDENIAAYLTAAAAERICTWHDDAEWAEIMRTFPWARESAGISEDDAAWYTARHLDDGEE